VPTYCALDKFEPYESFKGLNPFEKRSSFGGGSVAGKYSICQVTLKQIMSDLMSACNSDEEMRNIMKRYEKFLMEQFDELDSFLEADSIFTSTMDRHQRFDQYKVVMRERIANAKSENVKKVLLCMTKFVLEHDERLRGNTRQEGET
jgi:HD superfamily phosphohydrolase